MLPLRQLNLREATVSVTSSNGLSRRNLLTPITVALLFLPILASTASLSADQSVLGAGNQAAQQLAVRSPLVSSAIALITQNISQIADPTLRSDIRWGNQSARLRCPSRRNDRSN